MKVASTEGFEAFATSHLVMLALFILGIAAVIGWGRHHAGTEGEQTRRRAFAVVIGALAGTASVLDLLGSWPWYVAAEIAIICLFWLVVMTVPWEVARRRQHRRSGSSRAW